MPPCYVIVLHMPMHAAYDIERRFAAYVAAAAAAAGTPCATMLP